VRIYDMFFDYDVLLSTDAFFRKIIRAPEFQRTMSSAEFHHLCGKYVVEREKALGIPQKSLLARRTAAACRSTRRRRATRHRHEHRRARARGGHVPHRSQPGRERDGEHRAARQAQRREERGADRRRRERPRTSRSRRSRRSRKCSGSMRRGTTTSCRSPTRGRTRGLSGCDAGRGGELGEDRPGQAAGRGGVLPGFDDRAADPDELRAGQAEAARL
jgi:hypothetical protein